MRGQRRKWNGHRWVETSFPPFAASRLCVSNPPRPRVEAEKLVTLNGNARVSWRSDRRWDSACGLIRRRPMPLRVDDTEFLEAEPQRVGVQSEPIRGVARTVDAAAAVAEHAL